MDTKGQSAAFYQPASMEPFTLGTEQNYPNGSENNSLALDKGGVGAREISAATIVIGIILSLVILFTLIGNCLVVTAVARFQRLRSVTNFFVVSLAVADLTVAILVMPYSLLFEVFGEWKFGWIFCYFWISCDVTCCTASILHLCVISLDRYLAITQPLTYKTKMSKRRAILMICGVWICSGAISFVPIYLGWFADTAVVTLYQDSPDCGLYVNKIYAVISSMTSFYVPLVVMLFAYVKIFRIARAQAAEIKKLETCLYHAGQRANNNFHRRSRKINKDSKAIKTLGTLMGLFCVSWVPFFLMYLITPFCPQCYFPPLLVSLITWLGYANSFINPCVYALLNRDFRMAFKKILLCGRKTDLQCLPAPTRCRKRRADGDRPRHNSGSRGSRTESSPGGYVYNHVQRQDDYQNGLDGLDSSAQCTMGLKVLKACSQTNNTPATAVIESHG